MLSQASPSFTDKRMLHYRDVCVCAINFKPLAQKVVITLNRMKLNIMSSFKAPSLHLLKLHLAGMEAFVL